MDKRGMLAVLSGSFFLTEKFRRREKEETERIEECRTIKKKKEEYRRNKNTLEENRRKWKYSNWREGFSSRIFLVAIQTKNTLKHPFFGFLFFNNKNVFQKKMFFKNKKKNCRRKTFFFCVDFFV